MVARQCAASPRRVRITLSPLSKVTKRSSRRTSSTARRAAKNIAPNGHIGRIVRSRIAPGYQRDGARKTGNPHSVGYSCRLVADDQLEQLGEFAVLADHRPSLFRSIWRGMYRVKNSEGSAAVSGLESGSLRGVVYRHTQQGGRSIHQLLKRMLRRAKGRDLKQNTNSRDWTIKLVMAVRLLWSEEGPSKVYRGVSAAPLGVYEDGKASGTPVLWDSFTSTSTSRQVADCFRTRGGGNGVLFVIRRDPSHRAAADISRYSQFPDEHEVLLLPRMRFHVLNVHHRPDYTEVVLEEVKDYPDKPPPQG